MVGEIGHGEVVDAWIAREGAELDNDQLLRLFEAALGALWRRTFVTLGVVTLTAIAERVLYDAVEEFSALSSLRVTDDGFRFDGLRDRIADVEASALKSWIRFVLVELLTVLGGLTAEILTPALHAELARVAVNAEIPARNGESTS